MLDDIAELVGASHVLTGDDAARYGKEWTGDYPSTPKAVVRPSSTEDVAAVLRVANAHGLPVVPVSGNTGLTGGTHAEGAIMLSLERMNRIRDIRPEARVAEVDAGVVLETLREAVGAHDLQFPMTFGARGSAMIGGMLSTNAGGSNVLRYGSTRDLCLGLEVVTAQGEVMNLMSALHKNNSGYDLRHLMIGAEGTLGIITGAALKLFPAPKVRATAMIGLKNLSGGLTLLNRLNDETAGLVDAFEFMPANYNARVDRAHPDAPLPFSSDHPATILVELASSAPRDAAPDADGEVPLARTLEQALARCLEDGDIDDAVVAQNEEQRRLFWHRREVAGEVTFDGTPLVVADLALPLDAVAAFIDDMDARLPALDAGAESMSVVHLGDGNIHYSVYMSRKDDVLKDTVLEAIEARAMTYGGSFSAEHGVGLSKLNTMARRKDPVALDMMRSLKRALDPNNILNPGKVIPL